MEDMLFPWLKKCKKCGKEIYPHPDWMYRDGKKFYCSYKCFRQHESEKPKREPILPKIGDTIKIISAFGMPDYKNKIGVVKSIDFLGNLHGTWGKWEIIPKEDIYEILEDSNDEIRR